MNRNRVFQLVLLCIGVAISLLVMLGWFIHSPLIVRLHPGFHPMQFNTALGFLLVNGALFALWSGRTRLSMVFASALMAIFTLALLEHLFDLSLGIDTFFVQPFITQELAAPGRPGANTAVCFWLMAIGVWLFNLRIKNQGLWIGSVGAAVLGMSLASLWGYAEGLGGLTGWSPYLSGMAVHTAVAFVLCSLVLFSLLISKHAKREKWYSTLRPVHASILLLVLSLTIWNAMFQWDREQIELELQNSAESIAASIEIGFDYRRNSFKRLAQRWEVDPEMSPSAWRADAENYIADMHSLMYLRLRADGQRIDCFDASLGEEVAQHIARLQADDAETGVSQLFIIDEQAYIMVHTTLMREGVVVGDLESVMNLNEWLPRYVAVRADGLELIVSHKERVIFTTGTDRSVDDSLSVSAPLSLPRFSDPFSLSLRPTRVYLARAQSPWPKAILFGGLLGSLVLWLIIQQARLLVISRNEIKETARALTTKSQLLTRANHDLAELNREMEYFNRSVSHDLQSPLFSMKGYLSVMRGAAREGDLTVMSDFISRMAHITDRMSVTIDSILSVCMVGSDASKHVDIDLDQLVHETLEYIEGDLEDSNAQVEVADGLHPVHGDRFLLGNAIQNLVSNATKYARVPGRDLKIRVGTEMVDGMVCLCVEDNGPGIDPEYRQKIFDVFQRLVQSQVAGTGIGLSIVSRVARVHSGKAWVEDSTLGGARFCITVPMASARAAGDQG